MPLVIKKMKKTQRDILHVKMHAASAFSHASGHRSMWLSGTLTLVGEMNVHKLLQVSTSGNLKRPFVIFNKVSAHPYATPNPLCNSKKEESATTNYLISYYSKLNWFWSGCCQKKKKRKKGNLGPGEDYSVYKSKPAASICHGILFKTILIEQSPFRFAFPASVKKQARY